MSQDGFVAIIGMAGRFPGAADVDAFWANLRAARESLTPMPELAPPDQPGYVPAYGVLDGAADFDASFFGYSPQSALIIDPQQRVLLEVAHEALDRAGYGNADRPLTGVFVGGASTRYGERLRAHAAGLPFVDDWQISHGNDLDFLSGRLAYKLGLNGPAVSVQTACSTSLVAVHVAIQALLAGDCDLALAGGTTVLATPPRTRYTPDSVLSPDGHCRAFDASAAGTVNASGAGVVVLRPLADALASGDHIHAVVRGSAVNNDGRGKIGFTAPSVTGQAAAVRTALSVAGVRADEIGYVEAHGTATALGDPVEVAALTRGFRETTDRRNYCRIGSVKTNIGHTDAAAGVAGLMKATLAVEHGVIPASLHFREPNPAINFADSPFRVNAETAPWPADGGHPRIAAVNSVGIGGTNAHAVVAEPPYQEPSTSRRSHVLLPISAKTASAADAAGGRLAGFLAEHPGVNLADVSWTLRAGRTHHPHRRFTVARRAGGAAALTAGPVRAATAHRDGRPVAFLYAGQGGQHVGMASGLYAQEPVFRRHLDEVAELAAAPLGADLRHILFAEGDDQVKASAQLAETTVAQPTVFAVQYALTGLLGSWGLTPDVVTGHSLGTYAAACAAGIFTLPDAVRLVVERGRLLGTVPGGAMAAIRLPYADVQGLLTPGLSVGAVNSPGQCTVSGPAELVKRFVAEQTRRGVETRLLRIPNAGHSPLAEPILPGFAEFLRGLPRQEPRIPFISDMTGDWAGPSSITSVDYWTEHLRRPVRFDAVLSALFETPESVLVDMGPGRALSSLARQHPGLDAEQPIAVLTPHPAEEESDVAALLSGVGQIWGAGGRIDIRALHSDERRRRLPLPTYPFERQRILAGEYDDDARTAPVPAPSPSRPADDARAPRPTVLEAVLGAFGGALGIPDVEPEDNFFDLGGDSLIAVKVAAWAATEFAAAVSGADIIRSGDAGRLARLIEERIAAGEQEQEARA
jgi:phthiocerol/phenolphthiocerol synthesis type-I polyketide synthase E